MKKVFLISSMLFATLISRAQVTVQYDEFKNQTTYRTPLHHKGLGIAYPEPIVGYIVKNASNESDTYISARVFCHTIASNAKGIHIIFEDGSKLDLNEAEVDFDYNSVFSMFVANAFADIDNDTMLLIAQKKIKAIRLYIYDRYLTQKESTRVNQNFISLLNQTNQ
jgi:hypothetical protein